MKIEIGKTYRTRNGNKAVVELVIPEPSRYQSRFIACLETEEGWDLRAYKEDGTFGAGNGPLDIVSEWIDKPEWCKGNPAWARWQAHDAYGNSHWYVSRPYFENRDFNFWENSSDFEFSSGPIPKQFNPVLPLGCRWQDSLVEAPEGWGK